MYYAIISETNLGLRCSRLAALSASGAPLVLNICCYNYFDRICKIKDVPKKKSPAFGIMDEIHKKVGLTDYGLLWI